MAYGNNKYGNSEEFFYTIEDNFDYIIEEKANQFTSLRKIDWGNTGNYKLDLRRYYTSSDGTEKMGKGISFMTEEGPSELTKVMLGLGYCETVDALTAIKDRPDFRSSLNVVLNNKDDEFYDESAEELKGNYYDPKDLIL